MTGRRPTNSGIIPNLLRSSGSTCANSTPVSCLVASVRSAREADALLADAVRDDLLEPDERAAEDEQDVGGVDRMSSCCGCLRPPCGGTEASVPSRILRSACCTPSPDTSRVIERFSALRATLSISSM